MSRRCTICTHPDRQAIDQRLVAGDVYRRIATDSGVSESALRRHKSDHLGPALREAMARRGEEAVEQAATVQQAREAVQTLAGVDLLERLELSHAALRHAMAQGMQEGDWSVMIRAARAMDQQTELIARLRHELSDGAVVNVTLSPEWTAVRTAIVQALAPFPEARFAVAGALHDLETGA